jgi:hypothetical protein
MPLDTDPQLFTRRRLLLWASGATALCGRLDAFASDFWNKKGPADWSSDEVHEMLNKSPWAKSVTSTIASRSSSGNNGGNNAGMGGNNRGGMGGGGGGMGGGGRGGMGGGGMGGGGTSGGGTPRPSQQVKGTVRWESAKPILEASKETLPDTFADHYVISVIGFPLAGRKTDDDGQETVSKSALERYKSASSLTPKGKDAVKPDVVLATGIALLLGFAKDTLKLSPDDKEVAFATTIGRNVIKAKFTFKEMMYHETLAV